MNTDPVFGYRPPPAAAWNSINPNNLERVANMARSVAEYAERLGNFAEAMGWRELSISCQTHLRSD
jgi:hypothetical protein